MKIVRKDAITICMALGYATASKWKKDRMNMKMKQIAELAADGLELEKDSIDGPKELKWLNGILKAMGQAEEILVVLEDDDPFHADGSAPAQEDRKEEDVGAEGVTEADEEKEAEGIEQLEGAELPVETPGTATDEEVDDMGPEEEEPKPTKKAKKPKAKKPKAKKPKAKKPKAKKPKEKDKFGLIVGTKASIFWNSLSDEPMSIQELVEASGVKEQAGYAKRLCEQGLVTKVGKGYQLPTS